MCHKFNVMLFQDLWDHRKESAVMVVQVTAAGH